MKARVRSDSIMGRMVSVQIDGDPFPVYVDHRQIQLIQGDNEKTMATTTKPDPKELRRKAKALKIEGWADMNRSELAAAVAEAEGADDDATERRRPSKKAAAAKETTRPAKKAPAKEAKAPAKKAATKAPAAKADGPNPFRPNTNLWHITEALMKGGKRSTLVQRLLPKLEYNPRTKSSDEFDAELETDRRLKVVGYLLKNRFGFEYEHRGRGSDAYIKATPPAA